MRIFLKLRPKGVRLGPTDVLEPLFECLYSPFNLRQYFKDGVHGSKIDYILVSDPDASPAFLVGSYYPSGNGPYMWA